MSKEIFFQKIFPRDYHPGVWAPALILITGFLALETFIHGDTVPGAGSLGLLWLAVPLLIPDLRTGPGRLRRALVGYGLQLGGALALTALPVELDLFPCLHISAAFFVFLLTRSTETASLQLMAAVVLGAFSGATLAAQRHDWLDISLGLALGGAAYRVAFARDLGFLELAHPWQGISFHLRNLQNLLFANRRSSWEAAYAAGEWDFLRAPEQRPRHYAIAGLLNDRFPDGARVLDVGCGHGPLWTVCRPGLAAYTGLDLSTEAVEFCRKEFGADARCRFEQGGFEDFRPASRFDAVVLNEVLYYFPLARAEATVAAALDMLDDGGIVIVSMNRNPKSGFVWSRLESRKPIQSLSVTNTATGSCWTIKTYERG